MVAAVRNVTRGGELWCRVAEAFGAQRRGVVGRAYRGIAEVKSGGGRCGGGAEAGLKEKLKMLRKPIEKFQKTSKIITCDFYQFTEVFRR